MFDNVNLPEIQTDVETDLNASLKANLLPLGAVIFVAMLLAFVLGSIIAKKFGA